MEHRVQVRPRVGGARELLENRAPHSGHYVRLVSADTVGEDALHDGRHEGDARQPDGGLQAHGPVGLLRVLGVVVVVPDELSVGELRRVLHHEPAYEQLEVLLAGRDLAQHHIRVLLVRKDDRYLES